METDQPLALGDPAELVSESGAAGGLRSAAALLGWPGVALPGMRLFGSVVAVVAVLDDEVHAQRCAIGWGPVVDRTEIAMWSWPENRSSAPSPAVHIAGVLVHGDRWRQAIRTAAGFGGFGSTGVMVDSTRRPPEQCLLTARLQGVGLVRRGRDGSLLLVDEGRTGPVLTARPTVVSRWVQELVYERLLSSITSPDRLTVS